MPSPLPLATLAVGPRVGQSVPDDQYPELDWRGDVPVARRFDDPYFSLEDGLAETGHVFFAGNRLPERFRPGFHIAELGFGTGLNAIAALLLWRKAGMAGPLRFTSFELFPMRADQIARALSAYPEIARAAAPVLAAFEAGALAYEAEDLILTVVQGDARDTVAAWQGRADAWFLDGFSPAKNPELWEPALLAEVARHTAKGGTAATYSAAGRVRAALGEAGFVVERRPGFARKRHMTVARLP
ncbi:MAG: tRNA (5-methylaminomethyl-2-thiouridine)(34)-methyltransferase MnmD [Silicimonas sp.]|nr:tRNA (5-methylaminomethyl-2-thiouridine)(34)-methyltransferase MnmD [Silicimonas sp.]